MKNNKLHTYYRKHLSFYNLNLKVLQSEIYQSCLFKFFFLLAHTCDLILQTEHYSYIRNKIMFLCVLGGVDL